MERVAVAVAVATADEWGECGTDLPVIQCELGFTVSGV